MGSTTSRRRVSALTISLSILSSLAVLVALFKVGRCSAFVATTTCGNKNFHRALHRHHRSFEDVRHDLPERVSYRTSFSELKGMTNHGREEERREQQGEDILPDDMDDCDSDTSSNLFLHDRRKLLTQSLFGSMTAAMMTSGATLSSRPVSAMAADIENTSKNDNDNVLVSTDEETGKPMYKTPSGLQYIDLDSKTLSSSGRKITPRYGQLVGFSYTGYLLLPTDSSNGSSLTKRQKFATGSGYVTKHGNGKLIAGLEEGIHTMHVGQQRRLVIPPKLGFVASGLGPLPEYPWQRWKLNSLLEQMVAQRGGRLIYDVRLERILDDEADQGYYEDLEITPEERTELEARLNKSRGGTGGGVDSEEAAINNII